MNGEFSLIAPQSLPTQCVDVDKPLACGPILVQANPTEADLSGFLEQLLEPPGFVRQSLVNAQLEKVGIYLYNTWVESNNNNPVPVQDIEDDFDKHLEDINLEYTKHKIGDKITVTRPCNRVITVHSLQKSILNWISWKTTPVEGVRLEWNILG